jgi:hypothetical protein
MSVIDDIIAERKAKINRLEQLIKDKDIELFEMYKELEYFENKNDLRPVSLSACKLTGRE